MAVEPDLANATAEDLIVVMGIVGCKDHKLRGDPQKLEAPKLEDIIKLGKAFKRKTFAKRVSRSSQCSPNLSQHWG